MLCHITVDLMVCMWVCFCVLCAMPTCREGWCVVDILRLLESPPTMLHSQIVPRTHFTNTDSLLFLFSTHSFQKVICHLFYIRMDNRRHELLLGFAKSFGCQRHVFFHSASLTCCWACKMCMFFLCVCPKLMY